MNLVWDGIYYGLLLAFVFGFGAAFVTLIQTSINRGFRQAAWFALGVNLNDAMMATLCIMTSIRVVVEGQPGKLYFSLGAGIIIILFGVFTFTRKVKEDNFKGIKERTDEIIDENKEIFKNNDNTPKWYAFLGKGFVLNLLNPFIWLFWVGMVAMITPKSETNDKTSALLFFAIMIGTGFCCDLLKAKFASFLKKFFDARRIRILNIVTGIGLVLFGLYFIIRGIVEFNNPA